MAQEARIDVELTWKQAEEKSSADKVAEFAKNLPQGPWFGTQTGVARDSDRQPKHTWPLQSARPYQGEVAVGEAAG
ncbi:hypothetical protein AB0I10_40960 [Streptomyces sp. NPDC050636]|uniref:hypothetical protein n=1 Tax=Streptomyces sp. NPDC050636 TaxID=3154510 RepID=UPI00341FC96B